MEWVEMTGKTIAEARDQALEVLGVAEEDAEIDVVEEPRAGLFGLMRGEARVRARVRPTEVRPKIDRRRGRRTRPDADGSNAGSEKSGDATAETTTPATPATTTTTTGSARSGRRRRSSASSTPPNDAVPPNDTVPSNNTVPSNDTSTVETHQETAAMEHDQTAEPTVTPDEVGRAAVEFLEGLVEAFGLDATVTLTVEGTELDVEVAGDELGLLIGPGGRTLLAVQDLVRVAAQRRLGDHETRLRIDVAGYRQRRREALERFATSIGEQVLASGRARSLEPMPSADRKVIHDVIVSMEGVTSRSEGDDPDRRVVVVPA